MKSLYISPEVDITIFEQEDVITTSIAVIDDALEDIDDEINYSSIK